jgi:dTDP-4-dehydrorhamnose reductase
MTGLVLGRSGQLATHLRDLLPDACFWGRAEQDLSDPAGLYEAIVELRPAYIVNAAAYTAVDRAESEQDVAWRINVDAVVAAARAGARLTVPFVQVSTDYVFNGLGSDAYAADAPTCPINAYGRTKLAGELAVATHLNKYWTLRTSWVFSEHGSNFVKTMLRLGREREVLRIVADQVGIPTYAGDLANVIAGLLGAPESVPPGTYHAVGGPAVSWFEFAQAIFGAAVDIGYLDSAPKLEPIPSGEYPTPAPRPANSRLSPSNDLLHKTAEMDWRKGLRQTLSALEKV